MGKTPTDIVLYTTGTPNGIKSSILLEELNLEYKLHPIKIADNQQKEPWFLEINPNGRIPAMTDKATDGQELKIWESGAMMQYLVDRYDTEHKISYPHGSKEHWETTSWLMWQMGGLGPMQGQANHFKRYAPEKIKYATDRYLNETRRLYRVLNDHLAKSSSGFIVGDRLTIADVSCWGWISSHSWAGVAHERYLEEFPDLEKWLQKCLARPGFEAGRHVPTPHASFDHNKMSEEELEVKAKGANAWILKGMQDDAKK